MTALLALLVLQSPGYTVQRDVVYASVAGEELKVDLFVPDKPLRTPIPAAVALHGGAWISGKRTDMDPLSIELAKRGVFVAAPQYRLAPKHKWPAMIDDAKAATRWLRANAAKYGLDKDRIGAIGVSAGAHLALLLGSTDSDPKSEPFAGASSRVKAVVSLSGPVDMSQDFPKSLDPIYLMVLGKKREEAADQIRSASPVNFVDKRSAPAFLVQGTADEIVPFAQLDRIVQKYKAAEVRYEAVVVENAHHGLVDQEDGVKAVVRAVQWLVDELKR
ncbi:MAG: alpha/beta hydrolase [Fimbriimonadaceae bacterium]|nr:alpha/beta hydrolase [Fimbriimonadaceae bacterium]